MAIDNLNRLGLYQPKDIVPIGVRTAADQSFQDFQLEGDAILALVYVHAIDPGTTLQVHYYDSGAGTRLGEKNLIASHPVLSSGPQTSRMVVSRITNKVRVEWVITGGGAVHFGLYAYVVSSGSSLDAALVEVNGDIAVRVSGANFSGTVSISGLREGGRITEVALNPTTWTPLPAVALLNRNALNIQNSSGEEIKVNYDSGVAGYKGIVIGSGSERSYDIQDDIVMYGKSVSSVVNINVEEIA